MRKIFIPALIFLLLLILPTLYSCGDGFETNAFGVKVSGYPKSYPKNAVKLINDKKGNLTDEKNGLYYIYCKGYLTAANIETAVYAVGDNGEKLYEVVGLNTSEWLSEHLRDVGTPLLFREQSVKEPTLEEFETGIIHVAVDEELSVEVGVIDSETSIAAIVNDFINGEEAERPNPDFVSKVYKLFFESQKYEGIYYVLEYITDHQGKNYLFCRWSNNAEGRCVRCSVAME